MDLQNIFEVVTAGDIAVAAVFLLSLVQITPIKLNPWSFLAKHFGRAINNELMKEIKCMRKDLTGVHQELDDLRDREERKAADDARNRILRFADELRQHVRHSKEFFENILCDIDFYLGYCRDHDEYPNSKADAAIKYTLECYERVLKDDDFI